MNTEESMSLLVMGPGSERILSAADSSALAHTSWSMSLSECSAQLRHGMDEAFKQALASMSEPNRRLVSYLDRLPVCSSRSEALRTAFVFVLHVNPSGSQASLQEQLTHYGYILNELRQQKRGLRPSRAVLLVRTENADAEEDSQDPADFQDSWENELEEFELVHGDIHKCGPVSVDDAVGLGNIFQNIAISRKSRRCASRGSDSDGSNISNPTPLYEAEREDHLRRPSKFKAQSALPDRGLISL